MCFCNPLGSVHKYFVGRGSWSATFFKVELQFGKFFLSSFYNSYCFNPPVLGWFFLPPEFSRPTKVFMNTPLLAVENKYVKFTSEKCLFVCLFVCVICKTMLITIVQHIYTNPVKKIICLRSNVPIYKM